MFHWHNSLVMGIIARNLPASSEIIMQTEIEIKFFIAKDIQQPFYNVLNSLEILSSGQAGLGNVYFDTPDLALRRLDMGLRIRRSDDFAEQTIKCRGQSVGGLHARPEYNEPIAGELPELSVFPAEIWPSLAVRDGIQANLVAQFRTDFQRHHWLIAYEGAEIELAWDRGEIVGALGRTGIDELELELKSGEASALFALAEKLAALGGLRLGAQSKAQRGYRLAGLGKPLTVRPLPDMSGLDAMACISLGLQHWQHHEQLWLESKGSARCQALAEVEEGMRMLIEGADRLASAPAWLAGLRVGRSALGQANSDEAQLASLFHRAELVQLQLAIAAWLHLGD